MKLLRVLVATLFVALSGAACTEPPPGTPVSEVDQQLVGSANGLVDVLPCGPTSKAQTFTAGRTGTLDKVSVVLEENTSPGDVEARVEIQTVLDGLRRPSDYVIGSGTTRFNITSGTDRFIDVPLAFPAPVQQGVQYALVVTITQPCPAPTPTAIGLGVVASTQVDPYPYGELWSYYGGWAIFPSAHADLLFRTWVR